jgi:hypothetical protein
MYLIPSMGKFGKTLALFLTVIFVTSCLTLPIAKPVNAQLVPTPSIPQFNIKFVNASYTSTTTNSYTGQSQTQLINNNSIEITIKNQPYDYSNNDSPYQIYFNIRIKPHFSNTDNWTEVYPLENLTSSSANTNGIFPYAWYIYSPVQSNSTSTIISFQAVPTDVYPQATGYDIYGTPFYGIPIDSQLDFQVEALVGHNSTYWYIQHPFTPTYGGFSVSAVAYDLASGWSNTQTITLGETAFTSTTSTPIFTPPTDRNPTHLDPIYYLIAVSIIFAIVILSLLLFTRHRKTAKLV